MSGITQQVYEMAITESFNGAFDHYDEIMKKLIFEIGAFTPSATVLEMNVGKYDGKEALSVEGQTYAINKKARDFVSELGVKYGKKINSGDDKNMPVSIIISSEVWTSEDKEKTHDTDGNYKGLQDKDGNPINGATERLMISGLTATQEFRLRLYSIIRDKDNNIIDLVLDKDKEIKSKLNEDKDSMLTDFYSSMAKEIIGV